VCSSDLFSESIPITGVGKIALIEAYRRNQMASTDKMMYLVRDAWRNGDFDEEQELNLQSMYGKWLTQDDYIGRIDRLLWEDKTKPAKRIISKVPSAQQKLFLARISLIEDNKTSVTRVNNLPSSLAKDPGLIYDRMQYRLRHDDTHGVREMLLMAPEHVPYPEKWWRAREYQVHKAIMENDYGMAKRLLANHGQVAGAALADATWLKGWILCEFMKQPKEAYHIFYDMYEMVNYPVSKARAAYWAARAAEKAGDKDAANNWYNTASVYPTTFYGQLAAYKHNGNAPLRIPAPPVVSGEERAKFENSSLAKAIKLSIEVGELDMASRLMTAVTEHSDSPARTRMATEIGRQMGQPYLAVRAAKKALQKNVVLIEAGYPTVKTPDHNDLERPLALAIIRQESEYDPRARSPAGAMGLMQLMPRTAKEVAKKNDIAFKSPDRLYEAQYNITLGSAYLARMISSYDGSYVMAIAAYNAGPGNVRNWSNQFGTPGNNIDNAVNWIEKIPYVETRNYVQRVMENLQVYRHLASEKGTPNLKLGEDLMR
jgi:soluble lytic murein transglycosylase